jgi:hypothetical protein
MEPEVFPEATDEFILSLMKEWYDTRNIELLVKHFAFFEDIDLDENRKRMIFILSNECENYIGNKERLGIKNVVSCAKFLNDLSNVGNSESKFAIPKILQQCAKIIPDDGIVVGDALSPVGKISAVASVHFGSGANYHKSSLFDKNIPGKDINLSLFNGAELLRPKKNAKDRCIFVYGEGLPKLLIEMCNHGLREDSLASN